MNEYIYVYIYIYIYIYKSSTIQQHRRASSYEVVMYIQKLHPFCNTSYHDDVPKLGGKYLGNNYSWKIYKPIPAEYHLINSVILKD